ncbi:hypothetical protein [Rufibacter sp. LB8]|uniref:hypothetical protein n=1 Tax=Rufibacter sp. LB8 TaxID=2777781 RepID=UPI00178C2827|nr:hypothetical protein [Rufibacter sp. LB8]
MKKLLLFAFLLATVGLQACSDEESVLDPATVGYDYYPMTVGEFKIFNVSEKVFTNNLVRREETFQTREYVKGTTTDQTGRLWYQVELARRPVGGTTWMTTGIRLVSPSKTDLRIQENNKTTVHMVFPVKQGYSWVYNGLTSQEEKAYYTYEDLGKPFVVDGGATYENTLTVRQDQDFEDELILVIRHYEVLAPGKGPVYRFNRYYQYCQGGAGSNCEVGTNYIVDGSDRVETLVESGMIN